MACGLLVHAMPEQFTAWVEAYYRLVELRGRHPVADWPDHLRETFQRAAQTFAARQETPLFPPILYIEPTNACNCNCVICPRARMTRRVGYMDLALFRRIIAEAAALGCPEIRLFNFGEPTLHPQLAEMVRCCTTHRLPSSFQTNGLNVRRDKILDLIQAGLGYIGVSVNGLNRAEYETIRPGFDFARLQANLRRLRQIAIEFGRPLQIHLSAQVLKEDLAARKADIEEYKRTWLPIADSLSIFGLSRYDQVAIMRNGGVTATDLADLPRKADTAVTCAEPFDRLVIKWDGRATPCCVDYDAQYVVGDLNTQPLAEVWKAPALERLRAAVKGRQYQTIPLCRTCPKFYSEPVTILFRRSAPAAAAAAAAPDRQLTAAT